MNAESLRREVYVLIDRYEIEPEHPWHVAALALQLFDQLAPWHGLGPDDRLLLEAAASLHDIGWSQTKPDSAGHHKASAKLIREHSWPGLTLQAVEMIAQIARYHRKSLPKGDHPGYSTLNETEQRTVRRLAALLRVADGLDRRHVQAIRRLKATMTGSTLTIDLVTMDHNDAELEAADKKADLLRLEVGGEVQFRYV